MEDDKIKQQALSHESNAERDQDEGQMNNGTIGGNMGIIGNNKEDEPKSSESRGSKAKSQNTEYNLDNTGGNSE